MMRVISRRTVAVVFLTIGIPLILIGYVGDADAKPPPAKCQLIVNWPNIYGNWVNGVGQFGYNGTVLCKNHDPNSTRVTFQILRNGNQWAIMHSPSMQVQLTRKCRRGGRTAEFRGRLSVDVKDVNSNKRRFFTRTGVVFHWRCLP